MTVDEQVFLTQLYQCVFDGGITVWVKLHGFAHNVGHLVTSVLHAAHGVQDAALHRFQSVHDVGYGTFQYDIRGIVQKPVLIHAAQLMLCAYILGVGRLVVGMVFSVGIGHLVA